MACPLNDSRPLVASAIEMFPYFMFKKDPKSGDSYSGIGFKLLQLLGSRLKFSFEVRPPKENHYSGRDSVNQSWQGLVGMLVRKAADLVVTDLGISEDRAEVIDYSTPFFSDIMTFAVRQRPISRDISVLRIFSPQFLHLLLLSILLVSLLSYVSGIIVWRSGNCGERRPLPLVDSFIHILSTLWKQALPVVPSSSHVWSWCLYPSWWMLVIHVHTFFSSDLVTFLNLQLRPGGLKSVDMLIQEASRGRYLIGSLHGSMLTDIFESEDYYRKIRGSLSCHNTMADSMLATFKDLHHAACYPRSLLCAAALSYPPRTFIIFQDPFFLTHYAVGLQKGSCWKSRINPIVSSLVASGLIRKLEREALNYTDSDYFTRQNNYLKRVKNHSYYAFTIKNLSSARNIFGNGILLAVVCYLLEALSASPFWSAVRNHMHRLVCFKCSGLFMSKKEANKKLTFGFGEQQDIEQNQTGRTMDQNV